MAVTRLSDPTPRMTLPRSLLSEALRLARSPLTAVHLVCGLAAGLACGEYFSVARWDPALGADAYAQFLGALMPLMPTEYAICEYLARHPGQVMSRAQIREAVLGWESDADDAAISMQVSRARRKLSEAGADPIATVWGMGYKWQL